MLLYARMTVLNIKHTDNENCEFYFYVQKDTARGFHGSVNISESYDFRSQFEPLYIMF